MKNIIWILLLLLCSMAIQYSSIIIYIIYRQVGRYYYIEFHEEFLLNYAMIISIVPINLDQTIGRYLLTFFYCALKWNILLQTHIESSNNII